MSALACWQQLTAHPAEESRILAEFAIEVRIDAPSFRKSDQMRIEGNRQST
jgi:hypothetical protein